MGKVVDLSAKRRDPHIGGRAVCLACRLEWMVVAPLGVFELQCPGCKTMRGVFRCPVPVAKGCEVWTCTREDCGCEHMTITRHSDGSVRINCARCGCEHSIDDVFPLGDPPPAA